jgi:hypothetical protein
MKRSATVQMTLVVSMALVGCGGSNRNCVDANGRPVPDTFCTSPPVRGGYHWFYMGTHGGVSSGARSVGSAPSSQGVSRGGFGSTGSGAHAGG